MQGDQKPIQAFCFHSEHLCRPASRRASTWPGSPPLSRAPGTRADGHPHIAGAALCDPAPSEPGGRGEEVRTRQQGPRGAVTVALPGRRRGSRLGHDPPPRRWRPRELSARANRPPRGDGGAGRTAGGHGTRAWGHAHSGGWLGPGGSPQPGGARSQGREVGCAGGGTHGRTGEGGTLGPELGPGARRPPGTPSPEPRARSGGPRAASASTHGLRMPAPAPALALTRRTHARARAGPARSVLRPPSVCPSAPQPRLRVTSQCMSPAHPGGGPSGAGS